MRVNKYLLGLSVMAGMSACTVNKDIMFRTPRDYEFKTLADTLATDFDIQPNDYLEMRLFANDGFELVDLVTAHGADVQTVHRMTFRYLVESDGNVKLPVLGRVPLADLTMREAEFYLEDRYSAYYNRPFIQLAVTNRRVVVFPGEGGDASVVNLENNNTTLLEVLANVGGIPRRGQAAKVKLFRKNPVTGARDVYQFDLSDIDGLHYGDLVMQGDDVLYVQPNPDLARELLYDLTPLITLLTTIILVIGITQSVQQ